MKLQHTHSTAVYKHESRHILTVLIVLVVAAERVSFAVDIMCAEACLVAESRAFFKRSNADTERFGFAGSDIA